MESKQTPAPQATPAAARSDDESITAANARIADLRLLRGLCVHVLEPIVAKAQAILRDASLHLAALEQEEDNEEAANARENTADADAFAMLPGFFTALERAAAANGTSSSSAAASASSTATSSPPSPPPPAAATAAVVVSPPQGGAQQQGPPTPKDALAAVVSILCLAENAISTVSLQLSAEMARAEILPALNNQGSGPNIIPCIAVRRVMLRMLAHKPRRPLMPPSSSYSASAPMAAARAADAVATALPPLDLDPAAFRPALRAAVIARVSRARDALRRLAAQHPAFVAGRTHTNNSPAAIDRAIALYRDMEDRRDRAFVDLPRAERDRLCDAAKSLTLLSASSSPSPPPTAAPDTTTTTNNNKRSFRDLEAANAAATLAKRARLLPPPPPQQPAPSQPPAAAGAPAPAAAAPSSVPLVSARAGPIYTSPAGARVINLNLTLHISPALLNTNNGAATITTTLAARPANTS